MVALAGQPARAAHYGDPAKLAEPGWKPSFAGDWWIIGVEFHIARNKQIQEAIVIVVAPGRARGPSTQRDSSLFRDVGKGSVVIVVVEARLVGNRNVCVRRAL